MKNLSEGKRGFHWSSKAFYNSVVTKYHDIFFGLYCPDGGSIGEMAMVWHKLAGKDIPRLECFDDAWIVLFSFNDVLYELTNVDNKNITEEEFVEILLAHGFKDLTDYKDQ
jgi:hypothetical protein